LVMRDVSDDETLHCGVCGKPVLIRHGRVSLHARPVWVGVQEDS
jgi:hypothetical protein